MYQQAVDIYFEFYELKKGFKPSFSKSEGVLLKEILKKIKTLLKSKGFEYLDEKVVLSFMKFLHIAYEDKWRAEHFRLGVLNKQFDEIIAKRIKEKHNQEEVLAKFKKWVNK